MALLFLLVFYLSFIPYATTFFVFFYFLHIKNISILSSSSLFFYSYYYRCISIVFHFYERKI
nr:MAG TPA: hypothetical protein [Caudoviricetes sp.]